MPKWLSSLLIAAGFFALIGLAFLPRSVEVKVEVNSVSTHSIVVPTHAEPVPTNDDPSF